MPVSSDPRLIDTVSSVNEQALDIAIRHAILMERWKSYLLQAIILMLGRDVLPILLRQIDEEILKLLNKPGITTPKLRLKQLQQTVTNIAQLTRGSTKPLKAFLAENLTLTAKQQASMTRNALQRIIDELGDSGTGSRGIRFSFKEPSSEMLAQLVKKEPFQGGTLKQWMAKVDKKIISTARNEIKAGIVNGDSAQKIARNVRKLVPGQARNHISSVVRTATNHVSTQARETTYAANKDVIKQVRFVATLDARTTPLCGSLDGKLFEVGKGPRPPMHFNCRSTTVPVMKSWEELGIPLKDIGPGTRASMNGQVPGDITYEQWLKKQPREIQDEALGRVKGRLFREGKIEMRSLVNQRYRPLSLEEIRVREGLTKKDIKP